MHTSDTRTPRGRRLLLKVGLSLAGAVALTAALLPGSGSAVALVPPDNTSPAEHRRRRHRRSNAQAANQGTWSGTTPMSFWYRWAPVSYPMEAPADGSILCPYRGLGG